MLVPYLCKFFLSKQKDVMKLLWNRYKTYRIVFLAKVNDIRYLMASTQSRYVVIIKSVGVYFKICKCRCHQFTEVSKDKPTCGQEFSLLIQL